MYKSATGDDSVRIQGYTAQYGASILSMEEVQPKGGNFRACTEWIWSKYIPAYI